MGLEEAKEGLLAGLLRAERELRQLAEERARGLQRVLTELAARLDGAVMEEIRRADPRAPESWDPERWRAFFARVLQEGSWGTDSAAREELARLREEIRRLQQENERLREALRRQPRAEKEERPPASPAASSGSAPSDLWDPYFDFEFPALPAAPPPRFASLRERWRRGAMAVAAVAAGMSVRQEVMDRVARAEGIGERSGSLKRLIESLAEEEFLAARTLEVHLGPMPSRVAVLELGPRGRELAEAMGWTVREGDLGRLRRLHRGDELEAHAAAALIFLYQARARGWRGMAMPEVPGPASPDALVEKDGERYFVEVERSGAEKERKWRNLQALQGLAAICAPSPEVRQRLAADCRAMGIPGVATDIVSLLQKSGELWIERWT
jgi:hypothetical protein